jgi:hypothetical protein
MMDWNMGDLSFYQEYVLISASISLTLFAGNLVDVGTVVATRT